MAIRVSLRGLIRINTLRNVHNVGFLAKQVNCRFMLCFCGPFFNTDQCAFDETYGMGLYKHGMVFNVYPVPRLTGT